MEAVSQERPSPIRLLALGDTAWTVEFGERIDPALHARVLGLADCLGQARQSGDALFAGIVDVVPTFRSLTVHYNPLACDGAVLGESLAHLAQSALAVQRPGRHWRLPVCFDAEFAPDLDDLAASKGLCREAVIDLMTHARFQVYIIGFMPGFPYMGGLPSALEMPRLASPRTAVPARSLAVAGALCAIYPWESPGGWRLLGRTPVPLFSADERDAPALLASGDCVVWQAIDRAVFREMEAAAQAGALPRSQWLLATEGA